MANTSFHIYLNPIGEFLIIVLVHVSFAHTQTYSHSFHLAFDLASNIQLQ